MRTKRPTRAVSDFRYSPLVAAVAVALAPQAAQATTLTVNNGSDASFTGTLRNALEFFALPGNCTGSDRIQFFEPNGAFVTNVSTPLPIITCGGLTIDGSTGPGGANKANVVAFFNYGGPTDGLVSSAAAPATVTVTNLRVDGFTYGTALKGNINAIKNEIVGANIGYDPLAFQNVKADLNVFQNNFRAVKLFRANLVDVTGNQVTGSNTGIHVAESDNVNVSGNTVSANQTGIYIAYGGSTVSVDTNTVISNTNATVPFTGIYIEGAKASVNNNQVSGNDYGIHVESDAGSKITANKIGTTADGSAAAGNRLNGILFFGRFGTDSVGTDVTGNTISANGNYGIHLDSDFDNVKIHGNYIGTQFGGTPGTGMGNRSGGILADCGNAIEVSNNTISGNTGNGIEFISVQGGGATNIVGNKIGVQGDGVTPLGNSSYGVALYSSGCGVPSMLKAREAKGKGLKVLGGTNDLLIRSNVIANNVRDGVLVSGGTGNKIVENEIYANGGKSINLGTPGGPRGNDGGDLDSGPNNGQNYPVIPIGGISRDWPNARTAVNFTLDTIPGSYRIDVYSNTSSPAGQTWQGSMQFTAGVGPTAGTIFVEGLSSSNQPNNFTLTATAPFDNGSDAGRGDTSEFSASASIAPTVAVTIIPNPPNLNFGQVPVNSVSPPQAIRLLSSGNAPYRITRMGQGTCNGPSYYGGPFMIANACVSNRDYAPGESCDMTVRFAPIAVGTQTQIVGLCDNTFIYGGRFFQFTGVGSAPAPVTIAPSEFDFGEVLAGSRSAPQAFAISNPGTGAIAIGPVTVSSGEFAIDATNCGSSIPAGGSCVADVVFQPVQPTPSTATLSVSASSSETPGSAPAVKIRRVKADSSSATAFLSGQGIQRADITLPSFIDFGTYTIGTPALRQSVVIENVGNAIVSFNNISVAGPFVLNNGCPLNIAPGEHCTVTLDFSTTTVGNFTGALSVVSNAAGGTRTIPLAARSVALPAAQLQVTPNSLTFGERLLGTTGTSQRVTIRNTGNLPAAIASITTTSDYVVLGNTCTLALAPSSTCFADVALRPAGFGPRDGSLFVNSDVAGSPNVVGLGGVGCRPFSNSASRFGVNSGFNCAP